MSPRDPRLDGEARSCLRRLRTLLNSAESKKVDLMRSGIGPWSLRPVPPADLPAAHELYRRVVERGGSGSSYVQVGLLEMIASTCDPLSTAFWLEILDLKRPRDSFAGRRRTYALAALALAAIRLNAGEAYDALIRAVRHPNPDVRSLAALYLGRACEEAASGLRADVGAVLAELALGDRVFGPRFQARRALQRAGRPVPLDHEGEVFLFKIRLATDPDSYRTIAVKADQNLDDLHVGIQDAFEWDADHLYSFFMNGTLYDWRYSCEGPFQKGGRLFANEAYLGNLGLATKHKFLYLFDYGDMNVFEVEVAGIRATSKGSRYPCVVEKHGKPPLQYHWG